MRDQHSRIAGFDGIRAIAVTVVILSHLSPSKFGGGWLGVDVFFVLSGYLITTLLVAEHRTSGRISLSGFYARRALRLYPALILMVLICLPWAALFGNKGTAGGYVVAAGVALTYMTDVAWAVTGTPLGGFMHTWSLSVEEHFYVAWPAALVLALRWRQSPLVWAAVGTFASWLFLMLTVRPLPDGGTSPLFYAPHTRAFELLLGCVLALLLPRLTVRHAVGGSAAWVGLAGLVALSVWITLFPSAEYRHLEVTAAGLASVLLVGGVAVAQQSRLVAALEIRPAVWLGRISYGAYLYHFPAIGIAWHEFGVSVPAGVGGIVVSLLLADMSSRWVERPAATWGRGRLARRACEARQIAAPAASRQTGPSAHRGLPSAGSHR